MKQIYKISIYSILLLLTLFFTSCRSKKKIVTNTTNLKTSYIISQLKSNKIDFKTFDAKFNLNIETDKDKQKIKGSLRIKKDSAIWISVAPIMGIEMARIIILPDSIKMFDRINKTYFASDFSFIKNRIHAEVDFGMLQSILLGKDFSQFKHENWNASIDGGLYKMQTTNRRKKDRFKKTGQVNMIPTHKIWLDKSFLIKRMFVEGGLQHEDVRSLTVNYKKFKTIAQQQTPTHIDMEINSNISDVFARLKYSRVNMNKNITFPFKIPKGYVKQ